MTRNNSQLSGLQLEAVDNKKHKNKTYFNLFLFATYLCEKVAWVEYD
jgi:hypothetical protein